MTNKEIKYYNSLMSYWGQEGIKQNNMEPKKTINWARIWQIIQAIITMILATETATRSL